MELKLKNVVTGEFLVVQTKPLGRVWRHGRLVKPRKPTYAVVRGQEEGDK